MIDSVKSQIRKRLAKTLQVAAAKRDDVRMRWEVVKRTSKDELKTIEISQDLDNE